jgi:hypothetical protein
LVRRKIPRKNVIQFVYRYGTNALEDWHAKLQSVVIPNSTRGDAVATLSLSARLKGEFLNRVVTPGQIFSLPSVDDYTMALEHSACGTLANASNALYASASKVLFFEVIEDKLRRRKVALTDRSRERQGMQCPASVQFYEGVHKEDGATLRLNGNPEVVDLMHVVPWVVWRGGLRTMTRSFSTIPGTIHAKDPIAVCQREWDFSSSDTPCVVILEKLVVDGWSVGPPLSEHTLSSPRIFHTKDHLASKPYLQCLAMLGNVLRERASETRDIYATPVLHACHAVGATAGRAIIG